LKILKTFTLVFIIVLILTGFQTLKSSEPVRKELLGNHNGSEVYLFTLTNKSGNVLKVTNYGDPESGRILEVITDQPGMQFFSGNGLSWKKSAGSGSVPVNTRSGFALETQHYPDSPNQPDFPSTILNPREKFKSRTIYRFSVKKQS
jgi:galactose mutarotase-like enzyme